VNTLFPHFTVSLVVGMMLLSASGCSTQAPAISAKTPGDDATPAVTRAVPSLEAVPASIETFAALLDRA